MTRAVPGDRRRAIPRTDALLADPRLAGAVARLGRDAVKRAVVAAQQAARDGRIEPDGVADAAVAGLPPAATSLRAVLNATGVLVHTNLGRAPLSAAAVQALGIAAGPTDVEFDLATGARARRGRGALGALAEAVPAAGAVHVVNNNAAALLLVALALAPGREIVLSRGELVEIGDGFRIPELLASTGARLREVGATNRTTLADYAAAIGPDTGFVLKVHPSNFAITGFTASVEVAELVGLGVPVVVDVGSGLLAGHPLLPAEPDVASALRAGASVVTASGDKLLGGPQCGLLFGEAGTIETLRRHPAARALRVDKLTLAALEATLRGPATPVAAALAATEPALRARAHRLAAALAAAGLDARAVPSAAMVGGGGAPGVELPSAAVSLPEPFAGRLRVGDPPVVGRLAGGRCLLDLRTVDPADDARLLDAVRAAAAEAADWAATNVGAVDGVAGGVAGNGTTVDGTAGRAAGNADVRAAAVDAASGRAAANGEVCAAAVDAAAGGVAGNGTAVDDASGRAAGTADVRVAAVDGASGRAAANGEVCAAAVDGVAGGVAGDGTGGLE